MASRAFNSTPRRESFHGPLVPASGHFPSSCSCLRPTTPLESYPFRGVPGPDDAAEDEAVVAILPKGAPRTFRTTVSLAEPGTAASFKVCVHFATGNESGSNAVTLQRP